MNLWTQFFVSGQSNCGFLSATQALQKFGVIVPAIQFAAEHLTEIIICRSIVAALRVVHALVRSKNRAAGVTPHSYHVPINGRRSAKHTTYHAV